MYILSLWTVNFFQEFYVCRVYIVDKSNGSSQINHLSSKFLVGWLIVCVRAFVHSCARTGRGEGGGRVLYPPCLDLRCVAVDKQSTYIWHHVAQSHTPPDFCAEWPFVGHSPCKTQQTACQNYCCHRTLLKNRLTFRSFDNEWTERWRRTATKACYSM